MNVPNFAVYVGAATVIHLHPGSPPKVNLSDVLYVLWLNYFLKF